MKNLVTALLVVTGVLFAADTKPAAAPPAISPEQQTAYFQAQSEVLQAQLTLKDAQIKLDQAIADLRAACPTLTLDAKRRPACMPQSPDPPKPDPVKPQEKK
jgi:hypothetical protein